jgi:hypothetical protein
MNFGIAYIMKMLYSFLVVILLVLVYTYIQSLETKGCACAMTPNSSFIKGFTIFAIIYLLLTAFIPESSIKDYFGNNIVILYKYIDLIFVLVFIYYIYTVFRYTRYLVDEKCKCSTDMRREIIMIGSMIELILLVIVFILSVITTAIFTVLFSVVKTVEETSKNASDAIRDPIGSLSKIPKTLKKEMKSLNSFVSNTGKEIKKIGTKRR